MSKATMPQFSIRDLLFAVTLVALFIAISREFVFGRSAQTGYAFYLPQQFAWLAVGYALWRRPGLKLRWSVPLGAGVGLAASASLTYVIAEGFRRMDYWDWSTDYPTFLFYTAMYTALGAIIGLGMPLILKGVRFVSNRT